MELFNLLFWEKIIYAASNFVIKSIKIVMNTTGERLNYLQ